MITVPASYSAEYLLLLERSDEPLLKDPLLISLMHHMGQSYPIHMRAPDSRSGPLLDQPWSEKQLRTLLADSKVPYIQWHMKGIPTQASQSTIWLEAQENKEHYGFLFTLVGREPISTYHRIVMKYLDQVIQSPLDL